MIEGLDPRKLTFSQAQDYEQLPQPLKLEELSSEARTHIWNGLYASIYSSVTRWGYGYIVGEGQPTIFPAVTEAEGNTIIESLRTLRRAGLNGSASHLRKASDCINGRDWAGSIRESIHAVESVARQLDPKASQTLGPALASIEKRNALHPALKEAFGKFYGYMSNEQGIRHALLDRPSADVGMDEALFMLGACASFASYLWRKYATGEA